MRCYKKILPLFLFLCGLLNVQAQSPEIRARAAFMDAQEQYGNGNFGEAIQQLNEVKELLGETNPRVEYLLCQSYMSNNEPRKAEESMKTYFKLADESDPNYNAMLVMIKQIEQQKEEVRLAKELAAKDEQDWNTAQSRNTAEAYELYLTDHPNGKYVAKAKMKIRSFPPLPLIDPRDGQKYATVRINGLIWMSENLRYSAPGSTCYESEFENCEKYGRLYPPNIRKSICPEGWRLPTSREARLVLEHALGSKLEIKKLFGSQWYQTKDREQVPLLLDEDGYQLTIGGFFQAFGKGKFKGMGEWSLLWSEDGYWGVDDKRIFVADPAINDKMSEQYLSWMYSSCRCVKDE